MKKVTTLVIVHQHPKILLGMKKRGFGAGKWNGFGGKVHDGETIEDAARRETKEEAGIEIGTLRKIGILNFDFSDKPLSIENHIFRTEEFQGEPEETEEMKPQWFHIDEIPFSEMWADDQYWMPLFLKQKKFKGSFLFGEGDSILEKVLTEVNEI